MSNDRKRRANLMQILAGVPIYLLVLFLIINTFFNTITKKQKEKEQNEIQTIEVTYDNIGITEEDETETITVEEPLINKEDTNVTNIDQDTINDYFIDKTIEDNKLLDNINKGMIAKNYFMDTILIDSYYLITIDKEDNEPYDTIFLSKMESNETGYVGSSGLIKLDIKITDELKNVLNEFPENLTYKENNINVYIINALDEQYKVGKFNYTKKTPKNYDFYGINLWNKYPQAGEVQ